MILPAHVRLIGDEEQTQPIPDHLRSTAQYASNALSGIPLTNAAYLAALAHDAGKGTRKSAAYQYTVAREPEKATRGSVNHTFAGVRLLLERFHDRQSPSGYAPLTAELLAYAAGAHHGLFDCVDMQSHSGFMHRLTKEDIDYAEARDNFFMHCATPEKLDQLFTAAESEVQAVCGRILPLLKNPQNPAEANFYLGLLARLLLSAVIDGDRRDTAEFMRGISFPDFPQDEDRRLMWKTLLARVEEKLGKLSTDAAINRARRILSDRCRAQAARPDGVYRLNLPTGAGKTLLALRYSLAHSAEHNKSRIIYLAPLLSILDQNAQVIRDYIQDDSLILEHHSNVIRSKEIDEFDPFELLTENWDAPIIISTLVQFLNTLYSGKTSCIRRFQALCNSVIIIDEVQTVPIHLLTLFNLAVNFLAEICGATVILMSATQPCLEQTVHPLAHTPEELVPYDAEPWRVFQRTKLVDGGTRTLDSFPDFVCSVLEDSDSLLVVCNKKAEVAQLYRALQDSDILCFHLSASMCVAHRRKVLQELQNTLDDPERTRKIVCISSQVIEAGVDISFSAAIRFTAGMDSAVQTAGRCNRNGDSETPLPVYLVQCLDEDLQHLPDIKAEQDATLKLLHAFSKNPERFDNDLTSDAAIHYYYTMRYVELKEHAADSPIQIGQKTYTLFDLLSSNECFCDPALDNEFEGFALRQAFKTAGEHFSVFEDNTTDILVPYEEGAKCITDLCALHEPYPLNKLNELLQQAKPYTVSIYEWQKKKLQEQGALVPLCGGRILALQDGYYNSATGLMPEQQELSFLGV